MKNSLKIAMYEVTFNDGLKVSVLCKQAEIAAYALAKRQDKSLLDIADVCVSWYL